MTVTSPPRAFRSPSALRSWLAKHHRDERELMLRCYKAHAADRGVTYKQALDEALCFGWIDGVRRSLDHDTFVQRFSPRKAKSYWSAVNTKRANELIAEKRMQSPGLAAFEARTRASGKYSFESKPKALDPGSLKRLRANRRAHAFFASQAPWYRRVAAFWVMSAKREETRTRRLGLLIASAAQGRRIDAVSSPKSRAKVESYAS